MVCVLDPEDVARELDDRVLEATSGPDQRDSALAGEPDGGKCALHVPIGTGRGDEYPSVARQPLLRPIGCHVGGWHPLESKSRVLQPRARRPMGGVLLVIVPHDSNGFPHRAPPRRVRSGRMIELVH